MDKATGNENIDDRMTRYDSKNAEHDIIKVAVRVPRESAEELKLFAKKLRDKHRTKDQRKS